MIRRENRGRRADLRTDGREGRKVGRGQADRRTADGRLFFPVPFLSGHLPSASFLHPFPIPAEKVGFDFCPPFPSLPLFPSFFLPPLSPRRSQAERARGASTNLPFNIRIFIQAAPPPQTLPRDGHSPATAMAWSSSIPLREGLGSLRAGVRSGSERSGSERMPPPRRRRSSSSISRKFMEKRKLARLFLFCPCREAVDRRRPRATRIDDTSNSGPKKSITAHQTR